MPNSGSLVSFSKTEYPGLLHVHFLQHETKSHRRRFVFATSNQQPSMHDSFSTKAISPVLHNQKLNKTLTPMAFSMVSQRAFASLALQMLKVHLRETSTIRKNPWHQQNKKWPQKAFRQTEPRKPTTLLPGRPGPVKLRSTIQCGCT